MAAGEFLQMALPGDEPLDHYTSAAFNAFAANVNASKLSLSQRTETRLDYTDNPNVFWVRNDSGSARDRFDILAPTGVVWTPTANLAGFQAGPILVGTLPTLANSGSFAMLMEPVAASGYARALFHGVVTKLQVDHEQHPFADVAASSARLTSNWYGGAKIVYKESGTGVKWAIVRLLGEMFRGPIEVVLTSTISPGSNGNAKVRLNDADASPTSTIDVHFKHMEGMDDAVSGSDALVWWSPDRQKFMMYNLECA
jgi:hypothetical protein